MDNISEREQPKPERVIHLGEEFHPFDPKYTIDVKPTDIKPTSIKQTGIKSSIQLNLEGKNFPIKITAIKDKRNEFFNEWGNVMTPFDPGLGYQIDSDDLLSFETRRQKTIRLKPKLTEHIDSEKTPYFFRINSRRTVKDTTDLLRRLRLHVFFPELRFEAAIPKSLIEGGPIIEGGHIIEDSPLFYMFYPADTGPLPEAGHTELNDQMPFLREGFLLYVPSDPKN